MSEHGPWTHGDEIADIYDEWSQSLDSLDTDSAVAALVGLAGAGPVLELAIGTGRLALPLAERGLDVHGIDISEEMVSRLRAKPGGDRLSVTIGDLADVDVTGRYRLIFVAFNTFFALLSQDEQVRCFANVAEHLTEDGVFVVEAFVPDLSRFAGGGGSSTRRLDLENVTVVDVAEHDPVGQRVDSRHFVIHEDGIRCVPVQIRYAYPSELDLMARLCGLRLVERWSNWKREPFDEGSAEHVSVYGKDSS
jgi:SAM-dependent methyltransferase